MVVARLEDLARRFTAETGVAVTFRARGVDEAGPLPDEAGQHLEQVLREALSNAARHGGASVIKVELTFAPDELDLLVQDDGCGIAQPPEREGEGLRNIRERARRMGGRAEIGPVVAGDARLACDPPRHRSARRV